MEKKTVTKEFYVSYDGKEFSTEKECKEHEALYDRIRYFKIRHSPDLTETGLFMHITYAAVYSHYGYQRQIAEQWAYDEFNGIIGTGIQGVGFTPNFSIEDTNEDEWKKCNPIEWGGFKLPNTSVFLSPIEIHGMGENIDYMDLWQLNIR